MLLMILSDNIDKATAQNLQPQAVICLQDGVYITKQVKDAFPNTAIYVLKNDIVVNELHFDESLAVISEQEWVRMCSQHQPIVTIQ